MNQKPHHKITPAAKQRFMIWLIKKDLSVNKFADMVGVSHQYLSQILNGKKNITHTVRELFSKGGYDLL